MRFLILFLFLNIFLLSCSNNEKTSPVEDFHILYISNLNGAIESCECGDPPLGGLSKISTVVNDYRNRYKNVVFIDGGDAFNSYPYKQLNIAVADAYKIIQPDIWTIAEQEFVDGSEFLINQLLESSLYFVAGNYSVKGLNLVKYRIFNYGLNKIAFTSYLQPGLIKNDLKPDNILFDDNHDLKNFNKDAFRVLLFHGTEKDYTHKINLLKEYDMILLAHQAVPIFNTESKPVVFGGLFDGEKILHISLHKSGDRFKINAEFIEIFQSIKSDPAIEKIVENYLITLQK
ncbi:MAG: hypothetical protein KDF60_10095 [Calditrichaeota bacterium]|nr:hypothetical protein [Calditrichota bacterium]